MSRSTAVPKGYKQTEVGIIPEDWEVLALGDCCRKIQDGNYGGDYPKANEFLEYGIPFLTSKAIGKDGSLKEDLIDYISHQKHLILTKAHIEISDVLFTNRGASVGSIGYVDQRAAGGNIGPQLTLLRANPIVVTPKYLFHSMKSIAVQKQIRSQDSGSAMNFFGLTHTTKFILPLPRSKAEQEAIAEALSDADALIESLEQLIAKKRHLKQGAMQDLIFPKASWNETTLIELADGKKELFDDGDWVEAEHITDEGVRLIQTGNIGIGQFIEKAEKKYIFESSFNSLQCKQIREGDLLICRLAEPAGRACILPNLWETKIVTSVDVTIFRPRKTVVSKRFLSYLFSTNGWFRAVNERCGGTTHKRISRGALGRIKIKIPSVNEQAAIAAILSDMDTEIIALEAKLSKVRHVKQGMMQALLTGRIRLI